MSKYVYITNISFLKKKDNRLITQDKLMLATRSKPSRHHLMRALNEKANKDSFPDHIMYEKFISVIEEFDWSFGGGDPVDTAVQFPKPDFGNLPESYITVQKIRMM